MKRKEGGLGAVKPEKFLSIIFLGHIYLVSLSNIDALFTTYMQVIIKIIINFFIVGWYIAKYSKKH